MIAVPTLTRLLLNGMAMLSGSGHFGGYESSEDYYEYMEEMNLTSLIMRPPFWLSAFQSVLYYVLSTTAIIGCGMNGFVFVHVRRTLKERPFLNPARTLLAMSASDMICLLCLLSYMLLAEHILHPPEIGSGWKTVFCKFNIYGIHLTSAFSVWCWMVLSTTRYLALFYPLMYRSSVWLQRPTALLGVVFLVCATVEGWLPAFTYYSNLTADCHADPSLISMRGIQALQIFEIVFTFFVPAFLTVFMDITVLCKKKPSHAGGQRSLARRPSGGSQYNSLDDSASTSTNKGNRITIKLKGGSFRRNRMSSCKMLQRYLLLTSLDILLNMPHSLIRLLYTFKIATPSIYSVFWNVVPGLAYVMYYSQYCINLLYVWVLVRNPNSTRQTTRRRKLGRCHSKSPDLAQFEMNCRQRQRQWRSQSLRNRSENLSQGYRTRSVTFHGRSPRLIAD